MKHIRLHIIYIFRRPAWWLGMLFSFIAMSQGMLSEGITRGLSLVHLMTISMNYGVFIPLAPLAAVLSTSSHIEGALGKTCSYPHLIRCSARRYLWETGISSALAGAAALATGWALSLVFVKILGNTPLTGENMLGAEYRTFGTLLTNNRAWVYFTVRFVLVYCYGFFCVCCAVPVAALRQEASVICLAPFVVLRLLQYFLYSKVPSLFSPTRILLGIHLQSSNNSVALITGIAILTLLCVLILRCSAALFERRLNCD